MLSAFFPVLEQKRTNAGHVGSHALIRRGRRPHRQHSWQTSYFRTFQLCPKDHRSCPDRLLEASNRLRPAAPTCYHRRRHLGGSPCPALGGGSSSACSAARRLRGRSRRARSNRSPCGGSACSRSKRTHLPEFEAFRKQLQDLAYVEGKNLAIDWRYAERGPTSCPSSRSNSSTCIPTSSFRSQRRRRPRSRRRQAIVSLESHRWDPKILPPPRGRFYPSYVQPALPYRATRRGRRRQKGG